MAQITDNIRKGFREAATGLRERRFVIRMDYPTIFFGALLIVMSVTMVVVALPFFTFKVEPSPDARPLSVAEEHGRAIYASNGCWYCHSQYLRPQDWTGVKSFETLGRVAQAGDFSYQKTMLLGSERTGPDLSQEGGAHPDDWHVAHFYNPRYTSVKSIMPQFSFWYENGQPTGEALDVIQYVQALGGKPGVARAQKQREVKSATLQVRGLPSDDPADPYKNRRQQVQSMFDATWANVTNPIPASPRSLQHGKYIYLTNCIGCHSAAGDGKGPAARLVQPQPFNFTQANQQAWLSDGQMYLALLYGVQGTSMPAWGDMLTVNDIWDTVNFLRTIPYGGLAAGRQPTIDMYEQTQALVRQNPQDPTKNPFQKQFEVVNKGSYYNPQNIGPAFNPNVGQPSTGTNNPSREQPQQNVDTGNYPLNNSTNPLPYAPGGSGTLQPPGTPGSGTGNGIAPGDGGGGSMPPNSGGGGGNSNTGPGSGGTTNGGTDGSSGAPSGSDGSSGSSGSGTP